MMRIARKADTTFELERAYFHQWFTFHAQSENKKILEELKSLHKACGETIENKLLEKQPEVV